ncbi:TMM54 protein, partial [Urocolius indicus]|nr:TMM54 protein [Urocolius indicus]
SPLLQKWMLFALSSSSSLCCVCCLLALAVSMGLMLGSQGRVLLAHCTDSRQCPFDPTRVYV